VIVDDQNLHPQQPQRSRRKCRSTQAEAPRS
jgi:hypothetical protein